MKKPLWTCPHCSTKIYTVENLPEAVKHSWEKHRYPTEMSFNGKTYRSGPTAILDRLFFRIINRPSS